MNDKSSRNLRRGGVAFEICSLSACGIIAVMVLASGCSSSSSAGGSTPSGDGGGTGTTRTICDKLPLADIQALIPAKINLVTTEVGTDAQGGISCRVDVVAPGIGLLIQTYPSDADKALFNTSVGDPTNPANHAISGIGDIAYYFEETGDNGGTGLNSPNLNAHKNSGSAPSCSIASNDPPDTTMVTTSDGLGGFQATSADVLTYVQLMGKVCNDVFAASN